MSKSTWDQPLVVSELDILGQTFQTKVPIVAKPRRDRSGQGLEAEVPSLRLFLSGETRDQLEQDLRHQMGFLWCEYGTAPDDSLTPGAMKLKRKLTNLMDKYV